MSAERHVPPFSSRRGGASRERGGDEEEEQLLSAQSVATFSSLSVAEKFRWNSDRIRPDPNRRGTGSVFGFGNRPMVRDVRAD